MSSGLPAIQPVDTGRSVGQQNILGKDDFLKLMLMQMRYQDPLNPMKNEAMLSQMAQFSSLEQQANMTKAVEESKLQNENINATQLLGRRVSIANPNVTDRLELMDAVVTRVYFGAKGPGVELDNGARLPLDHVLRVNIPSQEPSQDS